MDPPDRELPDALAAGAGPFEATVPDADAARHGDEVGMDGLGEIVARLEEDPDECWPAIESLAAVDGEVRVQIIAALAEYSARPGVRALLRLLGSARDPAMRSAARHALAGEEGFASGSEPDSRDDVRSGVAAATEGATALPPALMRRDGPDLAAISRPSAGRIVRSLVTALDGEGCGTIVVSASDGSHRRTAAFRCDVRRGILDVIGEVERDDPSAGRLIDEWIGQADGDFVVDAPELAMGLLGGSLKLSGPGLPARVRAWLEAIGKTALPSWTPTALAAPELAALPDDEAAARANLVLDACPTWLDRSALTFELAAEITLREGRSAPDPVRDAGAYRYLFEHLLIGRLELYARMLLWMAWVWHASGRVELARSAFALAGQLSDEQYAVPSHPFTSALSTRSLQAAQAVLLTGGDPVAGA